MLKPLYSLFSHLQKMQTGRYHIDSDVRSIPECRCIWRYPGNLLNSDRHDDKDLTHSRGALSVLHRIKTSSLENLLSRLSR